MQSFGFHGFVAETEAALRELEREGVDRLQIYRYTQADLQVYTGRFTGIHRQIYRYTQADLQVYTGIYIDVQADIQV